MEFLREFGFGGCLADDMGVGKTAQVLAHAGSAARGGTRPVAGGGAEIADVQLARGGAALHAAICACWSTPGLARDTALIAEHDLILTTYGTLLRDAPQLAEIEFDYVVLDEAQAVKNATTASAKAVRLLRGEHRLALSGTPVENHLGELWSLFEFLNPGMLGEAKVLQYGGRPGAQSGRGRAQAALAGAASVHPAAPKDRSFLVITHYQRLLNYIVPDSVHVMSSGRIVKSGGKELAIELEANGYADYREIEAA